MKDTNLPITRLQLNVERMMIQVLLQAVPWPLQSSCDAGDRSVGSEIPPQHLNLSNLSTEHHQLFYIVLPHTDNGDVMWAGVLVEAIWRAQNSLHRQIQGGQPSKRNEQAGDISQHPTAIQVWVAECSWVRDGISAKATDRHIDCRRESCAWRLV